MKLNFLLQAFPVSLLFASAAWANSIQFWDAGNLNLDYQGPFCELDGGVVCYFQDDGNISILDSNSNVLWSDGQTNPFCGGACHLSFQSDGNLVTTYGGEVLFNTVTGGRGSKLTAVNAPPYLFIVDSWGNTIWEAV